MAAAIVTTATTLEGQAFEIAQKLQELELAVPEETRPNQAAIDPDFEAQTMALSVTLPFTFSTNATGEMVIAPGTYL